MDSSAPSILPPRVRVPSTPSMLLSIYIDLCHVEKTKINKKEAGIGPFKKTEQMGTLACSGQFHTSMSCRGRLTKFHPSTSSGSFGRQCEFKQKLSTPMHSTLLDDFDLWLPFRCHIFKSQAHQLCFFNLYYWNCNEKRAKINKKRPGLAHF